MDWKEEKREMREKDDERTERADEQTCANTLKQPYINRRVMAKLGALRLITIITSY